MRIAWCATGLIALVCTGTACAQEAESNRIALIGDARAGYFTQTRTDRDDSRDTTDEFIARLRGGVKGVLSPSLSVQARAAGRYSTHDNHFYSKLFGSIPDTDGLRAGDSTIDELFVKYTPTEHWQIRIGRVQTVFELAGLPGGSLDRSDSPNVDISWTDGAHAVYSLGDGWNTHLILQRNLASGATNVRLPPLDYRDADSRISYFAAIEKTEFSGPIVQRAIDINYLPSALQVDGSAGGEISDYWAFVGRFAVQLPQQTAASRILLGGELGYAPNTPTHAAVGTGSSGDTGGLAWQTSLSWLDLR
ncbi:MAG: hypothetical protein ACREUQ_13845, partial [Burkholderiales bacterium]